ncbi:hypothetical protein [Sphingobium sp. TCM1]|uniref:hypothetical protein n=1 Tax=Sphingobium sp. TCM1 TaxID=453246 RepID=UPI000ADD827E|nr:hypothetical protein [Sphingobium sp. TCM1]
MRLLTVALLFAGSFMYPAGAAQALENETAIEKWKREQVSNLRQSLTNYTTCNRGCAKELAENIWIKGGEVALETIGVFASAKTEKGAPIKYLLFQSYGVRIYNLGTEGIRENRACHLKCDQLFAEVVELARQGSLGPLVRGDQSVFDDPRVLEIYLKNVKAIDPSELPWTFHNDQVMDEYFRTG